MAGEACTMLLNFDETLALMQDPASNQRQSLEHHLLLDN